MEKVTLLDMLSAREQRVNVQKKMLAKNHCPVISFSLNIPGEIKTSPLYAKAFFAGKKKIETTLHDNEMFLTDQITSTEKTGYACFFSVNGAPVERIKKKMVEIEDTGSLGRLYDIDVIDLDGQQISRQQFGIKARKCLICECEAHVCSRSRKHDTKELLNKIHQIITGELGEI